MYTSGWPKNQKRCWYNTGSPPPAGSKKVVLKFRSVNSIVIHPARTGNESNSKKAVIKIDQANKGILWNGKLFALMFVIVQIKFIAPKIEAAPDRWRLKIARSTAPPEWAVIPDNGGYTVQPVPTPASHKTEEINNNNEGGKSQKLILFILGKAISGAPMWRGTNQLPKPPISAGITIKKIIIKACPVTITLYRWWL